MTDKTETAMMSDEELAKAVEAFLWQLQHDEATAGWRERLEGLAQDIAAKAHSLLCASPAPVACEPLTKRQLESLVRCWFPVSSEFYRCAIDAARDVADAQRAKVRPVALPTRAELTKALDQKRAEVPFSRLASCEIADAVLHLLATKCGETSPPASPAEDGVNEEPESPQEPTASPCPACEHPPHDGRTCGVEFDSKDKALGRVDHVTCGCVLGEAHRERLERIRAEAKENPLGKAPVSQTPALDALYSSKPILVPYEGQVRAAFADDTRALRERCERLEGQAACDACGGTGKPVSGLPCMCKGTGKAAEGLITLREELYDTNKRAEEAERELATARDELATARLERDDQLKAAGRYAELVIQERNDLRAQLEAARAGKPEGKSVAPIPKVGDSVEVTYHPFDFGKAVVRTVYEHLHGGFLVEHNGGVYRAEHEGTWWRRIPQPETKENGNG